MDRIPDKPAPTLRHESSIVSDYSVDSSSTVIGSPPSPIQHRAGYRRVSSMGGFESSHKGAEASYREGSDESRSYTRGLGIDNLNGAQQASVQRAPSGSKREARTPNSTDTLLSPPSAQFGLSYTRNIDERAHDDSQDFSFSQFSTPSLSQPFSADSEFESLNKKNASPSLRPHDASGMWTVFYSSRYLQHRTVSCAGKWQRLILLTSISLRFRLRILLQRRFETNGWPQELVFWVDSVLVTLFNRILRLMVRCRVDQTALWSTYHNQWQPALFDSVSAMRRFCQNH